MAEYTIKDVIIDPEDPRLEDAIGKEVYYSNYPMLCLEFANAGSEMASGTLDNIYRENEMPFISGEDAFISIIIKKEETYSEHSEKWIKENNLKKGDYVKVIRRAEDHEDGWGSSWHYCMDSNIGRTMMVLRVTVSGSIVLEDYFLYPYFVLEKVEAQKPEYVPFSNYHEFINAYFESNERIDSECMENKLCMHGIWLSYCNSLITPSSISDKGITYEGDFEDWQSLMNHYRFLDGTPCGKLKE